MTIPPALLIVAFIAVFVAGGILGFLACGVMVAAGQADRDAEHMREARLLIEAREREEDDGE